MKKTLPKKDFGKGMEDEYGKYERNPEAYEKYTGYHEDHKCNVYDLFFQTSQCKAAVRRYRTVILFFAKGI